MSELSKAVEFIPNKVYYVALRALPKPTKGVHFFSIDKILVYWNFYLDFGPLNLGHTFRFCEIIRHKIEKFANDGTKIYLYSSSHGERRANAVCILCCWGMLFEGMTPEQAFRPFESLPPFPPFHDATQGHCSYKLHIIDCLRGLAKAIKHNYIDKKDFDVDEYEHFEKVENGDLSWLSRKFIAFAGPFNKFSASAEGYYKLTPEHYIPYFKKKNVTLVVRLNKKQYDEKRFLDAGIDHFDLVYPDGSNPSEAILKRFIEACEKTSGAVAVHCKAGLGRTGTCIGSYMMKHDRFTAREVIGWLRLCRPGSVIGPQQEFMESMEKKLWLEGEFTSKNSIQSSAHAKSLQGGITAMNISGNILSRIVDNFSDNMQGDNLRSQKYMQQTSITFR